MITAIIYDLGDIFFEAHLWRMWMWKTLSEINKFNGTFREFYELYESYVESAYKGITDYSNTFINFVESLEIENQKWFIEKAMRKKKYFEENRTIYSGVKETLRKLTEVGITNIVLSDNENGEDWIRSNILTKFNIDGFIADVVTSKETGITKPNPRIFDFILEKYSLSKNHVLFIAHDKDEIDGASAYGIKTIEFNNYLNYQNSATIKIHHFSEILDFLNNNESNNKL